MTEFGPVVGSQMTSECREPLVVLTLSEYDFLRKRDFLRSIDKRRMGDWTDQELRRVLEYSQKS